MKNQIIALCLLLVLLIPVTLIAEISGEIVVVHPIKQRELWVTHLNVGGTSRMIYEHDPEPDFRIVDVVTQKEGRYIAFLARSGDEAAGIHNYNIYIRNKYKPGENAVDITQNRFGQIDERGFDISKNGDIVFACYRPPDGVPKGIYHMPHTEFQKAAPRATLLVEGGSDPTWLPDGERIAMMKNRILNIMTIATKEKITQDVHRVFPIVSPDGQYIAVADQFFVPLNRIEVYSLNAFRQVDIFLPERNEPIVDFK